MLGSLGRVGGRGGAGSAPVFGARLVQPGAIGGGGLVTFSRSQVSSFSTATNAAGSVVEYVADVPRFNGASQQLLLEGQRTNNVSNTRGVGFVAGSPGTLPTGWTVPTVQTGLTRILSSVSSGGASGIGITFSGTASTSNTSFETSARASAPSAAPSQTRTVSVLLWLASGSLTNVSSITIGGIFLTSAGGAVASNVFTSSDIKGGLTSLPKQFSFTMTSTSDATIARFNPRLAITITNGATTDAVIGVAYIGDEIAPFASTATFPPVDTPGASTRGQDNLTSSFSSLFPTGVGTVLASFMLPQNAVSVDQMLFDISDGTVNNRIRVRNVAGGATIVAGRVIGGVSTDATTLGSMTAGTLFRVGLTFDGTTITANFNGGSNQTVSGQPTGLTTLRVGNNSAGIAPMFGECGYFDVLPYAIPAANLPAAVLAIP